MSDILWALLTLLALCIIIGLVVYVFVTVILDEANTAAGIYFSRVGENLEYTYNNNRIAFLGCLFF